MKTQRHALVITALTLGLMLGAAGCSTFNREWKAAGAARASAPGIGGRWEGTWSSQTNGHHGRLRCLLIERTNEPSLAQFHANYKKILSFSYTVPLTVSEANGVYRFQGAADLGRLAGGTYHYEGEATPTNFVSIYRAEADGGIFQMQRPKPSE